MDFVRKVEERLLYLGIKYSKMCKDIGMSPQTFNNYKNGTIPTLDKAEKIIKYLGMTGNEIFDTDNKNDEKLRDDEIELLEYYNVADNRGKRRIMCAALDEAAEQADQERTKSSKSKIG